MPYEIITITMAPIANTTKLDTMAIIIEDKTVEIMPKRYNIILLESRLSIVVQKSKVKSKNSTLNGLAG